MEPSFSLHNAAKQLIGILVGVGLLSLVSNFVLSGQVASYNQRIELLSQANDDAHALLFHVSQIQQFLTDVSATGDEGGYKDAQEHFQAANKLLDELDRLQPQLKEAIADTRGKLQSFHDTGREMAATYASKGRDAGNLIMQRPETGFDAIADNLATGLDRLVKPTEAETAATRTLVDDKIQQLRWLSVLINLLSIAGFAYIFMRIGRRLTSYLGGEPSELHATARRIATGDFNFSLPIAANDKNSVLAQMEIMREALKQAADRAIEAVRIKVGLDNVSTNVMIADNDRNIIYMNRSVFSMLKNAEPALRSAFPGFNADNLVGTCIDKFHKNPAHQKSMLANLSTTYRTKVSIGGRTFSLSANPVIDENKNRLGSVVEWDDITEKLIAEERERAIANENLRVKIALDNVSTNVMMADNDLNIIYMNKSVVEMLSNAEEDLRKALPNFSVSRLMGANIDQFHKSPSHQRNILGSFTNTYKTQINVSGRTFALSANPVVNDKGERLGSVVEWLDRTNEVAVEQEIAALVEAAVIGDFSRRIELSGKDGFFKALGEGMNKLMNTSETGLNEVVRVLNALSRGDLTETITNEYLGTFGQLKDDSNATVQNLKQLISDIKTTVDSINTAAKEIAAGNTDLSQRTEEQASSLEETASSMEELASTVKKNAENAKQANQLASAASAVAVKGGTVVGEVVHTMSAINESSRKIVDIISVIDGIAFQTNILALNAAVEAARAGEQGRGFAVVAGEVRNLAQRSAAAAKEIKQLISDSVENVEGGTRQVEEAGKTMEDIVTSVKRVTDIMAEIAAASVEQSSGIDQVNQAVTQMDEVTQQNAALVEQAAAAAESLEEQSNGLADSVSVFKLDQNASGSRRLAAPKPASATPARKLAPTRAVSRPAVRPAQPAGNIPDDDSDWSEF